MYKLLEARPASYLPPPTSRNASSTYLDSPQSARHTPATVTGNGQSLAGTRVCFTGESVCSYQGQPITRELASTLAANAGLEIADSVTKKLHVLVVADAHTQSGKARKARQYGTRIIHEPVFWQMLGIDVE